MELLTPSPPPISARDGFPRLPSPPPFRPTVDRAAHQRAAEAHVRDEYEKVYVAVGRSEVKGVGLLRWAVQRFGCREVVLLHVHHPSPTIPTLLGNIPVKQANDELVLAYRRKEKENVRKLLRNYIDKAQVKASILMIENSLVPKGIVDLIAKHDIKKLVMGTAPDNCMKVKRSSASYTAKIAPPFCEIWFVCKDKHIWTREVTKDAGSLRKASSPPTASPTVQFPSHSLHGQNGELISFTASDLPGPRNGAQTEPNQREMSAKSWTMDDISKSLRSSTTSSSIMTFLSGEENFSSEISAKDDVNQDILQDVLVRSRAEAEILKKEAFAELMKRRELETQAVESINRVKAFEASLAHETKIREELEAELRAARREQETLLNQRDEAMEELQKALMTIAILDGDVQEATCRRDEVAKELKLIEGSTMSLRIERDMIQQQREEAVTRLECWRCQGVQKVPSCSGFVTESFEFREFSFPDLQTATCDFSESFKIGQGSYGCVYKGEILNRSVAIKKLHHHYRQGQLEFQQEVHVLSNLRHPHLVTLLGFCLEAMSLVYDYLPNGSLQNQLFRRTNSNSCWTWKDRTCAIAQISSALFFLHSSMPEKVVHGDLKPENILLDSNFNCKIGDIGIYRLVPKDSMHSPSFRQNGNLKGVFSYIDPEYQRTGELTTKSDVYSFGIIVLQLLTGRPPAGLASEVRRAMLAGKLSSVLDMTAGEWPLSVAVRLAEFGLQCCDMNSWDRPELTALAVRDLENLHILEELPVPHFFLCPILQEIMHDPQIAADGFTYEGSAMRSWLESGRETSPMTNLKLDHLNMTPNRALYSAIQDWLQRSKQSQSS